MPRSLAEARLVVLVLMPTKYFTKFFEIWQA